MPFPSLICERAVPAVRLVDVLARDRAVGADLIDAEIGRRLVAVEVGDGQAAGAAGRVGQDEMARRRSMR